MRETRPSGSEGGARSIPCPYPYLINLGKARPQDGGARFHHGLTSNVTGAFPSALDLKVARPETSLRSVLTGVPLM